MKKSTDTPFGISDTYTGASEEYLNWIRVRYELHPPNGVSVLPSFQVSSMTINTNKKYFLILISLLLLSSHIHLVPADDAEAGMPYYFSI